ncbi:MAG: type II secretion system protein GspG [Epsilonproteobacteria bacterium]|nr:MAG: type II secretion system protein GspG [Campylobacterota bacterium]RLA67360.1 MAG: type II secretion system protein GspG [Campylobacterota bacterium]
MRHLTLKKFNQALRSQSGFSLMEILISLTLMGIAGSFVAGKVFQQLHEGNVKAAKIQMQGLAQRLQEFRRHCGYYPTSDQGLESLVNKPTGGRECKRYQPGGYLDGDVPLDPWEAEYVYISDGKTFNIISYGNDNVEGGEDNDADIPLKKKK